MPNTNEHAFDLMDQGQLRHYAFVLDRSAKALDFFEKMSSGSANIRARITDEAVQRWVALQFPFVVISGTWGKPGGIAVNATSIENLLDQALPMVMAHLVEQGGLCGFLHAIDDHLVAVVQSRLAQLQPVVGPTGVLQ